LARFYQRRLALFLLVSIRSIRVEIYFIAGNTRGKDENPMIKMFVTKAVISKGFDGAEALRYSENSENPSVRFKIGVSVYDKREENDRRYVNLGVKAFGYLVQRIRNMKLEAGAYVNIVGRYDVETWDDKDTGEKRSASVLIVDEIEFGDGGKKNGENGNGGPHAHSDREPPPQPTGSGQPPENFSGFESFGGTNPYFPEG
jgi:single-stranded DNA-binding protein